MATGTRIELCGTLHVEVGGRVLDEELGGRQRRLLLAYLVLHRGRPVPRDRLVEAIWGEAGTTPAPRALAPVLSRLRTALAPAEIAGRNEVTLTLPEPVWVDIEMAGEELAAARARLDDAPGEAAERATHAAELLADELLPGFDAAWVQEHRDAVQDRRVEALELAALAGTRAGTDALPAAVRAAREAVALAPFRESARVALIAALRAQGNAAEALRAYDDVRTFLRDELGATPGPALLTLHAELLAVPAPAEAVVAQPAPLPASADDLLEREVELHTLDESLRAALTGRGGVVLLEGPAGTGKTRLLDALREQATALGARVLLARSSVLEREFGFGVVGQLFEDDAGTVQLDGPNAESWTHADRAFAALRALHRRTVDLTSAGPLLLCVDDLQWTDLASLRFVAYLARRVEALPVLVAATVRTGEPAVDPALLGEIAQTPRCTVVTPAALSREATARVLRARLAADATDAFVEACHETTGGNPLLLAQLTVALESERVVPDDRHVAMVRAIGPRAVARGVLLRIGRLSPDAGAVARAIAVLGEGPSLGTVASLAGVDDATAAVGALARAEVLRVEEPIGFIHPLVRDAVYEEMSAGERSREHRRAAAALAERDAGAERVAAQLLRVAPDGDRWVVEQLREAADLAAARGAPESAVTLLERARQEPPMPELRGTVTLELGAVAGTLSADVAAPYLREAYAALADPVARGEAALRLSRLLLFCDDRAEAPQLAATAARGLPAGADDLRAGLEAVELVGINFGLGDPARLAALDEVRARPRSTGPGARTLTALAAYWLAARGGAAEEAAALAREALGDDGLVGYDPAITSAAALIAVTLADPGEGRRAWERRAVDGRGGGALAALSTELWGGLAHIWCGALAEAERWLERGTERQRLWRGMLGAEQGWAGGFQALVSVERGDLEAARARLSAGPSPDARSDGGHYWHATRGELLLAEGRAADVLAVADLLADTRPPGTHPVLSPSGSLRARALTALGRRAEARAAATEELELAHRIGAPWVVGRSHRVLAECLGSEGVGTAERAVELLAPSAARLEHAKALAVLGDASSAAGDDARARDAWARALELAGRCGATGLEARLAALVA